MGGGKIYMAKINVRLSHNIISWCQKLCIGPNFSDPKLAAPCNSITLSFCLWTITSFTNHVRRQCLGASGKAPGAPRTYLEHCMRKYFLPRNRHVGANVSSSCRVRSSLVLGTQATKLNDNLVRSCAVTQRMAEKYIWPKYMSDFLTIWIRNAKNYV